MARRTAALKPQLNQIRTWAREGRTDAWIAYQLGTTSATVQEFRFEYGLDKGAGAPVEEPVTPELVVQTISFDSPPPLPPLEPDATAAEPAAAEPAGTRRQRRSRPAKAAEDAPAAEAATDAPVESEPAAEGEPERAKRRRRRGGRGGGAAAAEASTASAEAPVATPEPAERPSRARKPRTPARYQGSVVAGAVLVDDDQIVLRRRTAP
jgi:hypothetical protein